MWTDSQRRTLIALAGLLALVLLVRAAFNRRYISDPQPPEPARMNELADRIDPNRAALEELIVLPQLGQKRAAAIVAYRERFAKENPGRVAFTRVEDLLVIKGIGAAMVQTLAPHLVFPASQPARKPN